jgi:hypothetical protein
MMNNSYPCLTKPWGPTKPLTIYFLLLKKKNIKIIKNIYRTLFKKKK